MRDRPFLFVASVLAALFVGAWALLLFDQSREDRIAKGVWVAGVDVGGLSFTAARSRLAQAMHGHLSRPVVVRADDHEFRLTPRAAGATFDVNGMVRAAVHRTAGKGPSSPARGAGSPASASRSTFPATS